MFPFLSESLLFAYKRSFSPVENVAVPNRHEQMIYDVCIDLHNNKK